MKVYRTDEIRNVVLLGHGGCGKTSLVEAMAYVSGAISRMGKVGDGNTISDFDKEEQKRKFSISTTLVPIEWEKAKINVLDTPGYFDFVGEVEEAVSAADAAVIVVSGKAGVEVGTEKAWELCDKYNLPRMVYVTEMDVDDASFRQVVQQLTDRYGKVIAPHFQPIREMRNWSVMSMSSRTRDAATPASVRGKSARSRITAGPTWRSTGRSFWRQWPRRARSLWSGILPARSSLLRRSAQP